jgi:hypothetical protein
MLSMYVLLFGLALTACSPHDPSLENSVKKLLDATTFDISMLDNESSAVVANGPERRFYTREEMAEVQDTARKAGTKYEASDFKLLSEDTSGQFASITYRVTWKTSVGNATIATNIVSHEIWEHQQNEWHRVFAAMDAKQL